MSGRRPQSAAISLSSLQTARGRPLWHTAAAGVERGVSRRWAPRRCAGRPRQLCPPEPGSSPALVLSGEPGEASLVGSGDQCWGGVRACFSTVPWGRRQRARNPGPGSLRVYPAPWGPWARVGPCQARARVPTAEVQLCCLASGQLERFSACL